MKVSILLIAIASATGVLAGCNCKCQDPSGTGPQWNDLTEKACHEQFDGESVACHFNKAYHGALQHHQCSSSWCCIDSGAFNDWCKSQGAPGAFCWD